MRLFAIKDLCSGCRTCQAICSLSNMKVWNPKKAALKIVPKFPKPGEYDIKVCTQCGICARVCPTEAISKNNDVFIIDGEKCTRCGKCVEACPFEVMILLNDMDVPFKCNGCGECVRYCPRKALSDRKEAGTL